jgi:hypothetical protein
MEFKGTKGNWVLKTFPEGQMSVRNEIDTRKICVPRVQNYEESLANLLLISKAPEMLEMLIRMRDNEDWDINDLLDLKQLIKEATEI